MLFRQNHMKTIFACLLCLVFATAQTFAIKGGPGPGTQQVRTTGIYAGVLTPGPLSPGSNSLGLFSITIPKSGIGTGTVIIFTAGETYTGSFQGVADPDTAQLSGEIAASFPYVEIVPTGVSDKGVVTYTTVTVSATAAGRVAAKMRANTNRFSSASVRLSGDSNIQFSLTVNNPFTQIGYIVNGFKQAELGASPF